MARDEDGDSIVPKGGRSLHAARAKAEPWHEVTLSAHSGIGPCQLS